MTLANNILQITELDFDLILQNQQSFLQAQNIFNSYNFTGSGFQVLLRELSYNTAYGAFMVNMLGNELTIATSQVRDNTVKHAKALDYVPLSMTSPTAFVNVIITPPAGNSQPTLTMPAYTAFQSQAVSGVNYTYQTTQAYVATLANGQFVFANVALQEGVLVNYTYTASTSNPRNIYNIPNANIDTSTLIVTVTENTPLPPNQIVYQFSTDVSLLTGNSRVYFLEGTDENEYNIYFGDGVLGRALIPGDTVRATYLVTNGPASNYANSFTIMAPFGSFNNVVVQAVTASGGGTNSETNDSVAFHAPLAYTTQERAVTIADYNFLLNRDYPNIASMAIWGGDQNIPPIYGTLFMSIKPLVGPTLSNLQKQQVLNILSKYTLQTQSNTPQLVDPNYTYLLVNASVTYNPNKTTLTQAQLIANITAAINNYSTTNLGVFNGIYIQSQLCDAINDADPSILGSQVTVYLQQRFFPIIGQSATYTLLFNTPLKQGGLNEKLYSSPGVVFDDSFGNPQNCFIEENINTYQGITSIAVTNPGFGFTGQPQVIISGDGNGASATAVIVNGAVQSVVLDTPGEGYSIATATVVGGGGYGAVLTPILAAQTGILDTYYYTNGNKNIINPAQGTVDHVQGIVTINNFAPLGVNNLTGQLTINVKPNSDLIIPVRNNILQIDPTDPLAVAVTLVPVILPA